MSIAKVKDVSPVFYRFFLSIFIQLLYNYAWHNGYMGIKKHTMRSRTSKKWLKEHFDDQYVKKSWKDGYRSRAAYKLLEIQEKYKIIKPNMVVVDLGAAPGGWSQLATDWVGDNGSVIAMDILPIDPLPRVDFIEGDFTDESVEKALLETLDGRPVDVVICDMAPNMSGNKSVDQPRSMYLLELAMDFADKTLKPGGDLLMKAFQGEGFDELYKTCQAKYNKVIVKKPDASRARSREYYILARGKR